MKPTKKKICSKSLITFLNSKSISPSINHLFYNFLGINIDATSVSDITIDGENVQDVTIDGNSVWTKNTTEGTESFEHGSIHMNDLSFVSDWSGNTAYISNTSDSISGSRSLYMNVETSSSQSVKCDFDFKPAVFEWKYKWNVYSTGSLGDKFFITLRDANGERLFYLVFEIDDTPEGDDQVVQPRINKDDSYDLFLDQKTTYTMKAVFDYSSNTFDFYVDGNLKFSDVSFMDSPSDFSNTTIHMQGNADANNWEKWVDDVYIKKV